MQQQMNFLKLPYDYLEWHKKIQYPYIVGECLDTPVSTEDGYEESQFILTVTTRDSWESLIKIQNIIKAYFPPIGGLRGQTDSGAIVVMYQNTLPIPTGEADLKRIQINLLIKEWKG
jgi:hypothetical protein